MSTIQIEAKVFTKAVNVYHDVKNGCVRFQIPISEVQIVKDDKYIYIDVDGKDGVEFLDAITEMYEQVKGV